MACANTILHQAGSDRRLRHIACWYIVPSPAGIFLGAYPYEWRKLVNDSVEKNALDKIVPIKTIDNIVVSKSGDYRIRDDNVDAKAGLLQYHIKTATRYCVSNSSV